MRGKNIWMTIAVLFIASMALSIINVPKAYADNTVSVTPYESGPKNPGDSFSVDIEIDYVEGVRAFEFTLSWNQKILRLDSGNPVDEGPFLPSGGNTFFVYSIGVAGESIVVADLITTVDWADGGGALATLNFDVVGGGQTNLMLTGKLFDVTFTEMFSDFVGGHFWSPFPYIAFTWYVPTSADGDPANAIDVEGGTMFYGDLIKFDASASYDLDSTGNLTTIPSANYVWRIRAGGVDSYPRRGDFKYETGAELGSGAIMTYTFPGALPNTYSGYGATHLGFHDLLLTVTDSDGNVATYYTWIRIFRLSPAKTVMDNIPNPKHSLSSDGTTKTFGGKIQNRGGTGWFPDEALAVYLELGRMIHGYIWGRMRFQIRDPSGATVATVYSSAQWLGPTEESVTPLQGTWNMLDTYASVGDIPTGTWTVITRGMFCASGYQYGLAATGSAVGSFEILP